MANYSFFLPLLFILITTTAVLENILVLVEGDPDLTFVSDFCGEEHDVNSLRKDQARRLVNEVTRYTHPGSSACAGTFEKPNLYRMASCSEFISQKDCADCIKYVSDQLLNHNLCHDRYGAQITVASCFLRFETYPIEECPSPS